MPATWDGPLGRDGEDALDRLSVITCSASGLVRRVLAGKVLGRVSVGAVSLCDSCRLATGDRRDAEILAFCHQLHVLQR